MSNPAFEIYSPELDDEGYIHGVIIVDGCDYEFYFRVSDPENGRDFELLSVDYGWEIEGINELWPKIKAEIENYCRENYFCLL